MYKFLLYYRLQSLGFYQHQLQDRTKYQCKTQPTYLSTNWDVRNSTLKYKTQLVDRKKYVKLYQHSIPTQVHQLCTTCHKSLSPQLVSSISSSKYNLLTNINHQVNSQPYAQYHQVNQQDTSRNTPYSP